MPNKIGIIGFALVGFEDDVKLRSDELVFKATKAALDMAGIKRRDLDVSVITSIDAYDGITISNGLMAPAGGGYQKDATRIQGGGVAAVESAYASILSNSAELAVVAGADAVRYDDTV
ncbi:MAG: thiolase family protein, partial [Thermodesulfobacteriota bacterium]|nr:thiolase family protein [Thermodesulfobacteriota bacterium]